MITFKKLNRDVLYSVELIKYNNCMEYALVDANTKEIYIILENEGLIDEEL